MESRSAYVNSKVDLRAKEISRDRERYIMIKVSIHQEDLEILNVYAPKNRASNGAKINRTKSRNR